MDRSDLKGSHLFGVRWDFRRRSVFSRGDSRENAQVATGNMTPPVGVLAQKPRAGGAMCYGV